jgi:AcrR family transcriptional regulator
MFMQKVKPKGRGRPRGATAEGAAAKRRLYETAIALMARRGYESTTLRDVAKEAGVSVGLLYRYFPSKRAVIVAFYEELSAEYAARALAMPRGKWRERFLFALATSLEVLAPHRTAMKGLVPVLVGDPEEGVFAPGMAFSRERVQRVFELAVSEATDSPGAPLAPALGRLLYLVHLAVLLWWLLDRSAHQRATAALVGLARQILPSAALTLRLSPVRRLLVSGDALFREAMLGEAQ